MLPVGSILALLLLAAPLLPAAPGYQFTLDGEPAAPLILPVLGEAKGHITEGDIASIRNFTFVVGAPGRYELRIQGEQDSALLCRIDGGPEHHLAIRICASHDDDDHRIDALAKLDAQQRKLLRGITLDVPIQDWAAAFKDIDWTITALSVTDSIADSDHGHDLPVLPSELRYLLFRTQFAKGINDFSSLQKLHQLRYANLDSFNSPLDLRWLRNSTQLRNLSLSGTDIAHPEGLAPLTEMRFLKLRWTPTLDTVAFAAHMPELRVLKIDDTSVADLRPLSELKHLRLLSANKTNVSSLPDGKTLPALREIRLLSTPVATDAETIAAFRTAAPDSLVKARWAETLKHALAGANRLLVREYDFSDLQSVVKRIIFEISNADMIDSLVNGIEIDEENSGFHCMCPGDQFLDFYKGDTLITTVGFHHGRSLRWSDGWPGDASISDASAALLCNFMADHGLVGPKEEREQQKADHRARDLAFQRYSDAVAALAPAAYLTSARELSDLDPIAANITEEEKATRLSKLTTDQWPDENERAKVLFSLYGALPTMSWLASPGLDDALPESLLRPASNQIGALLSGEPPNHQLLQGISRWCFVDVQGRATRSTLAPSELKQLATWGLSHPRGENRMITVLALDSQLGEPLLLEFLKRPPAERTLPEDQPDDPSSGSRDYEPEQDDLLVGAPPRAQAAFILAQRGCTAARSTIEKLTTTAPDGHRPHYLEALKILDGKAE